MREDNPFFYLPSAQLFPGATFIGPKLVDNTLMAQVELAKEYISSNKLDQALDLYTELINTYDNLPFLYACRSLLKTIMEEDEGAFYDYQIAKRLDFNYHHFMEWFGNAGEMLESDDLQELIEQPKTEEQFFINRATLFVEHFEYEKAIADFSKAFLLGNNPVVLLSKGAINMRMLRYDEALLAFNEALQMEHTLIQGYILRAKLYIAIREYELADNDFNVAASLSAEDVSIYEERAEFYTLMEKFDLAIADYSRVISVNTDDFYVYVLRADVYEKIGKLDKALTDYDRAITLNPYYSDLYQYRGDIRQSIGDVKGAQADYLKFEELENE